MNRRPSFYSRMDKATKAWCRENQDELIELWEEHLTEVQYSDSSEHYSYLVNSDDCFWEFCEEVHFNRFLVDK